MQGCAPDCAAPAIRPESLTPIIARLQWFFGPRLGALGVFLVSLPNDFAGGNNRLTLYFGAGTFSIVVQRLTMKPLQRWLKRVEGSQAKLRPLRVIEGTTRQEISELTFAEAAEEIDLLSKSSY